MFARTLPGSHLEALVVRDTQEFSPRTARVLVVDDDVSMRRAMGKLLKLEGHDVELAEHGEEGLSLVREQSFDVVILDMNMPGLSGLDVLARLRADPATAELPVLLCSGSNDLEDVVRCIELGADDYLVKPPRRQILFARVRAAIERKQARDQERAYAARIERERRRADALLASLFPGPVVQEFRDTGTVDSRRHDDVAVLFCDVVNFTAWCDHHAPESVVDTLQVMVSEFETIVDRYGLLKIKTVGDAFMATAGLLESSRNPVEACLHAAEEMVRAMHRLALGWDIRIGIHVGPVVSGVVGHRQHQFDVWGDTVNTAARIQGVAQPNTVTLSESARQRLPSGVAAECLGNIELKGKGAMTVFRISPVVDETVSIHD